MQIALVVELAVSAEPASEWVLAERRRLGPGAASEPERVRVRQRNHLTRRKTRL